jgi:hypothetical protein
MNSPVQKLMRRFPKLIFQSNPSAPLKEVVLIFTSQPPFRGLGGELFKNQNNLSGEADTH